jgi:hypothetical protein
MTTKRPDLSSSAAAIFARLWEGEMGLTVPVARHILKLTFREADQARIHELAQRNQNGELTRQELDELDDYIKVGDLLAILQSKARKFLKQTTARNGNGSGDL